MTTPETFEPGTIDFPEKDANARSTSWIGVAVKVIEMRRFWLSCWPDPKLAVRDSADGAG